VGIEVLDINAGRIYNKDSAFEDISELYTNNMVCRYSVSSPTTKLFHVVELGSGAVIDLAGYVPPGGTKCGGGRRRKLLGCAEFLLTKHCRRIRVETTPVCKV
jgi:hypothetical protein